MRSLCSCSLFDPPGADRTRAERAALMFPVPMRPQHRRAQRQSRLIADHRNAAWPLRREHGGKIPFRDLKSPIGELVAVGVVAGYGCEPQHAAELRQRAANAVVRCAVGMGARSIFSWTNSTRSWGPEANWQVLARNGRKRTSAAKAMFKSAYDVFVEKASNAIESGPCYALSLLGSLYFSSGSRSQQLFELIWRRSVPVEKILPGEAIPLTPVYRSERAGAAIAPSM